MGRALMAFDVAALLDSDEAISEYLSQVLADGDSDEFLRAVGYVAKARGMAQVAKDAGLGRESLYKAFSPGSKPRFDTVLKVMHALGIDLQAQAAEIASPQKQKRQAHSPVRRSRASPSNRPASFTPPT